jgi:hypothetical protein
VVAVNNGRAALGSVPFLGEAANLVRVLSLRRDERVIVAVCGVVFETVSGVGVGSCVHSGGALVVGSGGGGGGCWRRRVRIRVLVVGVLRGMLVIEMLRRLLLLGVRWREIHGRGGAICLPLVEGEQVGGWEGRRTRMDLRERRWCGVERKERRRRDRVERCE